MVVALTRQWLDKKRRETLRERIGEAMKKKKKKKKRGGELSTCESEEKEEEEEERGGELSI